MWGFMVEGGEAEQLTAKPLQIGSERQMLFV